MRAHAEPCECGACAHALVFTGNCAPTHSCERAHIHTNTSGEPGQEEMAGRGQSAAVSNVQSSANLHACGCGGPFSLHGQLLWGRLSALLCYRSLPCQMSPYFPTLFSLSRYESAKTPVTILLCVMQVLINSLDIGKAHHDKGSGFWYAVQASVRTGESMHANAVMQTTCN